MVLMPAHMSLPGPPSEYALRMRPWLLACLFALFAVGVARFVALDIIGGFFLLLTVAIGVYAVRNQMDITWMLCLAVVLILNAMFDTFLILVRVLHKQTPMFGDELPMHVNVVNGLIVSGPVFELITGYMCWSIYREHIENLAASLDLENDPVPYGYGAVPPPIRRHEPARSPGHGPPMSAAGSPGASGASGNSGGGRRLAGAESRDSFEAFQGQGRRLNE